MQRFLLSWVITLFVCLSSTLSQPSFAQCPGTSNTFSFNKKQNGFPDGGFELTYLSADNFKPYYVRLTFKVVNYYKNSGMDYMACQMPNGAGVVSSGVSCKSPLDRTYMVTNGTSVVNPTYATFYGAKLTSIDEKSQFKSGGNFLQNHDTYTIDMSLYEFSTLNALNVAVRAGGDGAGNGNERFFVVPIDVSGCKASFISKVAQFTPKMIVGPIEPMAGDIVQYSIAQDVGYSYKWGVPDVNDAQNKAPGWEIIGEDDNNIVTVKVGSGGGSMRVEVTAPEVGTNARTMPVTVIPNPLPVELVNFTANPKAGAIELNWSTATELDNDRFDVERSANGKDFSKIGEVKGAGNSSVLLQYVFKDASAPNGTVYYRLNQIDFDKDQEYSKVIAVKNNRTENARSMRLHPNPVIDGLVTVEYDRGLNQDNTGTIKVLDMNGRTMHVQELTKGAKQAQILLHSLGLRKGLYMISVTSGDDVQVQRILIQ